MDIIKLYVHELKIYLVLKTDNLLIHYMAPRRQFIAFFTFYLEPITICIHFCQMTIIYPIHKLYISDTIYYIVYRVN